MYPWWLLMPSQNGLLQKSLHCSLYVCLTALDFPILSQVHPFSHFRVILYQEDEEWMGVCRKRARGMIRWPHSPLPSTSCQGFPLAIAHLMCQPLRQKAGWRRVNSGSGGANRRYTAQYRTSVWAFWVMNPWSYICFSSCVGGLQIHWVLFWWGK